MPHVRPRHLTPHNAAAFTYESVARAYPLRPPYPDEIFAVLAEYFGGEDAVLDLGCGTGDIARRLAPRAARVDAVDPSEAMIAVGRTLPGGDLPNLHWRVARAEEFDYPHRYALVVTPLSLHWMDWPRVLRDIASALAPGGRFAVIHSKTIFDVPWREALRGLVKRYSVMQDFEEHDLIADLRTRGFVLEREIETRPASFRQSLDDYVDSWHSRAGFVRERMGEARAAEFDEALRQLVAPFAPGGEVAMEIVAKLAVGVMSGPGSRDPDSIGD